MTGDRPSKEKQLETTSVIALFVLVVVLVKHHAKDIPVRQDIGIYVAALFLFIGAFVRPLASILTRAWFGLSHAIGAVVSRVVLGVVFLLVLTPLSFLRRMVDRNDLLGLKRKFEPDRSYFVALNKKYIPRDLERPW